MPAQVDSCVQSLLAKWNKDPSSRPEPKEKGQDAKSQAWAICSAAHSRKKAESLERMLGDEGFGPTLIGAAATNRPYIPKLEETKVVGEDGEEKLVVHLANPGFFAHPFGPFTLNDKVFATMVQNFKSDVVGQKLAYDCRHKPDDGAYGWFEDLYVENKRLYGVVDPTTVGLERVKERGFLYSSMEFHENFGRFDVKLDLEQASADVCLVDYLEDTTKLEDVEDEDQEDTEVEDMEGVKELELEVTDLKAQLDAAEQRAKDAEEARRKDQERLLRLQADGITANVEAVVTMALSKGLPKQLIDWLSAVLRFEDLGEGDGAIRLSQDDDVPYGARMYLLSAAKSLVESLDGVVPLKRETNGGKGGDDYNDAFDYAGEWEDE